MFRWKIHLVRILGECRNLNMQSHTTYRYLTLMPLIERVRTLQ